MGELFVLFELVAYYIFVVTACLVSFVGSVWLYVEIFKTGILSGLVCLIVPPLAWVWAAFHWKQSAKPVALSLGGIGAIALVSWISHLFSG